MFKPNDIMASIKTLLFTSKTLKNGEHPIMLRMTVDRKSSYISVGHSCSTELWDALKQLPKRKHPLFKELVTIIEKKTNDAKRSLLKLENQKENFSTEELKGKVLRNSKKITVFGYFEVIINELRATERISYAQSHKDLLRELKKFTKNKDIKFSDINSHFLRNFEHTFRERGLKPNTIGIYFRTLRALYNKAVKDDYAQRETNPFADFSISHMKNKTLKRAITKSEVKKIQALSYEEGTSLFNCRNYFLFSFYCSGINFIDVAKLTKDNFTSIDNKVFIRYTRSKTKENFLLQLIPAAVEIYQYYAENNLDDYIFPFLSNLENKSAVSIYNRLHKTKRQVNANLKTIAETVGISVKLTTYVARHSFATVLKRNGISTSKISDMMGHANESITQTYLDEFENDQIYEASLLLE
jgi:site-specific recombinase XerD